MTNHLQNQRGKYKEIGSYVEVQYVSASETAWRIIGLGHVERQPMIVRMDLYLDGQHTVYYHEGDEQPVSQRDRPGTTIIEYFESNKINS